MPRTQALHGTPGPTANPSLQPRPETAGNWKLQGPSGKGSQAACSSANSDRASGCPTLGSQGARVLGCTSTAGPSSAPVLTAAVHRLLRNKSVHPPVTIHDPCGSPSVLVSLHRPSLHHLQAEPGHHPPLLPQDQRALQSQGARAAQHPKGPGTLPPQRTPLRSPNALDTCPSQQGDPTRVWAGCKVLES